MKWYIPIPALLVGAAAMTPMTSEAGQRAPAFISIDPSIGSTSGRTYVTITGSGFERGATVTFGGSAATEVTVWSTTRITALTPSGSGSSVTIRNPDGSSATASGAFTVVSPPCLSPSGTGSTVVAVSGGTITISIVRSPLICTGVTSRAPWIVLTGSRTEGTTTVTTHYDFLVRPNEGLARRGIVSVGAGAVVVEQAGAPGSSDADADGLEDGWERRFGLDPLSGIGGAGALGDPDADAMSNVEEQEIGRHPRSFFTRYFAEGATGSFFDLFFALLNPDASATARVNLFFTKADTTTAGVAVTIPPMTRATVDAETVSAIASAEFSTVVESDIAVVADRTMKWDGTGYGAHAETSIAAPATTWYLAEGATHSGFDLFYLIQNPGTTAATVTVTFLLPGGGTTVKTYSVQPSSRFNIWVDLITAPVSLSNTDVSAVITSSVPIVVERAMYLNAGGAVFGAGHESAGVTAPAISWFLAEGATGAFFDLFILLANPNAAEGSVTSTFLLPNGSTTTDVRTVPGNSRTTIWVDTLPGLANQAVSTIVTASLPIIVERAMWWAGPTGATWYEAHNSPGVTATGTRWALAEGEVANGANATETYILIANTSAFAGQAQVTISYENGTTESRTFNLSARSRFNVDVRSEFPNAVGRRFGAIIQSLGGTPAQIVVERAIYSNAGGVVWAAGTNAVATKLQ